MWLDNANIERVMNFVIDPHKSWLSLEAAAGDGQDARSTLIRRVRDHLQAEITGQLEPLMATLVDEPIYNMWQPSAPMVLRGADTISALYEEMFESGAEQFEFVIETVVADERSVVTEGRLKQVHTASALLDQGIDEVAGQSVQDSDLWLSDTQVVVIWPSDEDGKLVGEDLYYGEEPMATLTPIQADQLPPYFRI